MYSSVPTKEFDALIGSAMKIGFCWPLWCLFFSFILGIKSWKNHITLFVKNYSRRLKGKFQDLMWVFCLGTGYSKKLKMQERCHLFTYSNRTRRLILVIYFRIIRNSFFKFLWWHTCGLQDVKHDKSKSVRVTCPLLWSKTFSGFKSL